MDNTTRIALLKKWIARAEEFRSSLSQEPLPPLRRTRTEECWERELMRLENQE